MTLFAGSMPAAGLRLRRTLTFVVLGAGYTAAALAGPGELTVLSVATLQDALGDALGRYERETGRHVAVNYATPAQLASRLRGAEPPDLVVLAEEHLAPLESAGQLLAGGRASLGRVGLGVAVQRGAAAPDIVTTATFKQALVGARSLTYSDPSDSTEGRQVADVLAALGLADTLKTKTRLGSGSSALAPVGAGDVDLGLHPVHRILATPAVQLAGPLPAELQRWTRYDAALLKDAPNLDDARALMRWLAGASARAGFLAKGFQPAP